MSHNRGQSYAAPATAFVPESEFDIQWPFENVVNLTPDDVRVTAYEIFFTSCRSSPGFGGRTSLNYYPSNRDGGGGGGGSPNKGHGQGVGMAVTSRLKKKLGLKTLRRSVSNKNRMTVTMQSGSLPSSPIAGPCGGAGWFQAGSSSPMSPRLGFTVPPSGMPRRPLTSAEIMRQQMKVAEQSDVRLRKTLMRTLIGQMGRKAETIILPLELLRHIKPSEFHSQKEYHLWQKRQLAVLENTLLLYPSTPLDPLNSSSATLLRQVIRSADSNPLDTSKNSESMRILCTNAVSLAWRSSNTKANNNSSETVCHWADGYPFNINIYISLLRSIFDLKDETVVLDEVDELLELIKKTWLTLGITKEMHNICFAFVLFQQYVITSQLEPDLLAAALIVMSTDVAEDFKKEKDGLYTRMVAAVAAAMQGWAEKRLLEYHEYFHRSNVHVMESLLPLALSVSRILYGDVSMAGLMEEPNAMDMTRNRVEDYIRTSLKKAFAKILETTNLTSSADEAEASEIIIQLAKETEELATREIDYFTPILKKWHPISGGIAAVTLHGCYGTVLRQYLSGISVLRSEMVQVLERAAKQERFLVQILVEESENSEDGGKRYVTEMVPYEVDSIISQLVRKWLDDNMSKVQDCINRAKETESWNPKSKSEPYAYSGVELMSLVKEVIDEFFGMPISISYDLVNEVADGLDHQIQDYIAFVAACGSKQSYIPTLPPLTRNHKVSKIRKLLDKAGPCAVGVCEERRYLNGPNEDGNHHHLRPSTSRGTQRLYIRLNTLHYVQHHLNSLEKTISLSHSDAPSSRSQHRRRHGSGSFFSLAHSTIHSATHNVSQVAAYRLILLDSNFVFYDSLYKGSVSTSRIKPALRLLKQNISLLFAIVTDTAQPLALKEVMKATLEAFLIVLLAGGSSRIFLRSDHQMIEEDFTQLKRLFCTYGEGLISEEAVDREAETVEDIVGLMGRSTEQLVEDFSILACEVNVFGMSGNKKLHMPMTTGMWSSSDPDTILRILCCRNDRIATQFLKKTLRMG